MKELKEYNAETIMADEVFEEIFNEEDEIKKSRMIKNNKNKFFIFVNCIKIA